VNLVRFSKLFWNVSLALLATTVLILTTGVVGAAADILDSEHTIDPLSPNFDGSEGGVDASGDTYETWVAFECLTLQPDLDVDNDFRFECRTNHPDKINLSSGLVDQKRPNNNAQILWTVNRLDGINEQGRVYNLLCDKVLLKGKSKSDNEQIEASCMIKSCDPPPPTGGPQAISDAQLAAAFECLDTAEAEGTLGTRVQTLKLLENNTIDGAIRSKGFWATDN
jgi:hypothetical protein